jgi:hypothetical protein
VEDLKWLGHSHVVLRTDNEPAIVALLKQAMITLRQDSSEIKQVVEEHSSRYDSQSNGFIEATLRDVQGLVRTYMCALSQRLGQRIPPDHAVFSWLVDHAAWVMTTRRVGHDGRTAYARVRRHTFSKRGVEFGEKVLYKLPMKGPEADARGSMDPRYKMGIVLGFSKNSPDYWVFGEGQVRQYRSIQRRPSDDRWSAEMVAAVNVTPHDLHTKRPAQALGAPAPREPTAEGVNRKAPRMLLKQQDFVDFGYTADCKRCRHSLRYGYGKTKMPHSEACRARLEDELKKTADGRRRIELTNDRLARHGAAKDLEDAQGKEEMNDLPDMVDAPRSPAWENLPGGEQAPMTPLQNPCKFRQRTVAATFES